MTRTVACLAVLLLPLYTSYLSTSDYGHSFLCISQTSYSSGHSSPGQHAAMEDEPFNSSDIEFDDLPNPFSKAGARSIEAMLTSRHGDRVSSKKRLRQLQDTRGAPGTVEKRARWVNRLMNYVQMNEIS